MIKAIKTVVDVPKETKRCPKEMPGAALTKLVGGKVPPASATPGNIFIG